MNRGEIWWANLPQPVGRRPVLILTRSAVVAARNQLVVAQVTRTAHNIASEVILTRADGMPEESIINCDVLLTVPKSLLERQITRLSEKKMREVESALKFAMDIP